MPVYEYKCANGHVFETVQSMSDDPLTQCEICGAPVERVFHPVAVHFKGSGFYATDYGSKRKAESQDGAGGAEASKPNKKEPEKAKSDSGSGD